MGRGLLLGALVAPLVWGAVAHAGPTAGSDFTYQGRLTDDGTPVDGTADIDVALFDAAAAGNQIGSTQSMLGVAVADGLFTLNLDFGAEAFDGERWMELTVDGVVLSPRQKVTSAPYAIQTRGLFVDDFGQVGVGHNVPESLVHLEGGDLILEAADDSVRTSLLFRNNEGNYVGRVYRTERVPGSGADRADFRLAGGDAATPDGLRDFIVYRNNADGLHYIGMGGHVPTAHLDAANNSPTQRTFRAENRATTGSAGAILGTTDSPAGLAIYGVSPETGANTAVRGDSFSPQGRGVVGVGVATTGISTGVQGVTRSVSGIGVQGIASEQSGVTYGVLGDTFGNSNGFGVFSNGKLGASGFKTFRIDHPNDPANRYLQHYSSEGPEPMNEYSGNVILGGDGSAWVQLPDYYGSINTDERYTLTPIGAPAPGLYIAQEVRNNTFRIAGGQPGMKVSWRVDARRNDPYAKVHAAPAELMKTGREKGLYLQPALYGQPASKGMFDSVVTQPESPIHADLDR